MATPFTLWHAQCAAGLPRRASASRSSESGQSLGRVMQTKQWFTSLICGRDELTSDATRIVAGVELGGVRTLLIVPMLKEDE